MLRHYEPTGYLTISHDARDIEWLEGAAFGVDLEWNVATGEPTIIGISDGATHVSVPFGEGYWRLRNLCNAKRIAQVGHNFVAADRVVFKNARDWTIPLDDVDDTMILFWLTNAHLCKAEHKSSAEDADDPDVRGLMGLGTMASVYTSLPAFKDCPGAAYCHDRPCPDHAPYEYNGHDAAAGILALPGLMRDLHMRNLGHLYVFHKQLMETLAAVRERGVPIDIALVRKLQSEFAVRHDTIAQRLPFNPQSPTQIKTFFRDKYGFRLNDTQEATIESCADQYAATMPEFALLADLKSTGAGVDRWYGAKYLGRDGRVHPNLSILTSSSRLMCSRPNMQNILTRRQNEMNGEPLGTLVRRCVSAPEGYKIISADLSNGENRVFLFLAGYGNPERSLDLHAWLRDELRISEDDPFARAFGTARSAVKSLVHACDYAEGFSLVTPAQLNSARIRNEVTCGARIVFRDWTFGGYIVTFTGANLARRAFGDASFENRKRALDAQEVYLAKFPLIRELQRRILRECEEKGAVIPPLGYYLASFGSSPQMLQNRAKTALAVWGSQPVAHITKLAMNALETHATIRQVLQIHDEILAIAPASMPDREIVADMRSAMEQEILGGLRVPVKVKISEHTREHTANWADMQKVEL